MKPENNGHRIAMTKPTVVWAQGIGLEDLSIGNDHHCKWWMVSEKGEQFMLAEVTVKITPIEGRSPVIEETVEFGDPAGKLFTPAEYTLRAGGIFMAGQWVGSLIRKAHQIS